jgi:NADH-quinone oxidoreductase subunit J
MDPTIPYTACVAGAVALYLLIRPGRAAAKIAGAVIGLGAFAWLVVAAGEHLAGGPARPELFFGLFSLIAVASAVRMITHSQPVYSALYFILVVLSSAALFLLLEAEFVAFALVIVYAGAILVTYVFVLMLATQAPRPGDPHGQPEYDRVPREPAAAVVVGFILMALLTNMVFEGTPSLVPRATASAARREAWEDLDRMPARRDAFVAMVTEGGELRTDDDGSTIEVREGRAFVDVLPPGRSRHETVGLPDEAMPENVHRVGLELILGFQVSLELAGVILLMAMFGAVVLARRQIELGEDELREAAGLGRMDLGDEPVPGPPAGGDA